MAQDNVTNTLLKTLIKISCNDASSGADLSALLTDILAKLNESCAGAPINVNVCNQPDLTVIELLLTDILTGVQAIDSNTDTVEVTLQSLLTELQQNTLDNASIITGISSIISELQQLDVNTDQLETLLTTINTSIVTEGDQTQALLTSMSAVLTSTLAKLNETCAGSPINVTVCNPTDLTTVVGLLNSILLSVQAIDSNTDTIEASLTSLLTELQQNTTDNSSIITQLTSIISELQDIDTNTVNLETLLTSIGTLIVSEGDQTQAILTTVDAKIAVTNTELANINTKLNETCAGSPINVVVCNQVDLTAIEGKLDSIIAGITAGNALLSNIDANTDTLEASLATIISDLADIETDIEAGNATLSSILTRLTIMSTQLGGIIVELQQIEADVEDVVTELQTVNTELINTQTILQTEFDETQVILNQILNKKEFDQTSLNWLPYCIDGVDWYFADLRIIDNDTGIETGGTTATIYKQGVSGTITSTAPTGTDINIGPCSTLVEVQERQFEPIPGGAILTIDSTQVFTLSDALDSTSSTSFPIPSDAVGAQLQFEGGDSRVKWNGDSPIPGTYGFLAKDCSEVYLGLEPEHDNGCESELANFSATAEIGQSVIIQITYYRIK